MALIRFKSRGKWVRFTTKKRTAKRAAPKRKTPRKGSWPKGKTPPHLKKFLFR